VIKKDAEKDAEEDARKALQTCLLMVMKAILFLYVKDEVVIRR
jgi:hypothetical protein